MILSRNVASRALALLASLTASGVLYAETITLQALDDFPSTDGGEVPYYREDDRGTLAINAANEEYRDKFARATTSFSGTAGTYDLTLNTVGEEDGDCEYRVLVNGVVVGTVVNDSTTADFAEQQHTIFDITVPAGATLAVESNALSNGLIPENGGFAFARGRWRSLTLHNDDPVATTVDLQVTASVIGSGLTVGDSVQFQIDVKNNSTDTATQPVVTADIPASITITAPTQCAINGNDLTCTLPELSPQQSQSINLSGIATAGGQATLEAFASADQADSNVANNTSVVTIDVSAAELTTATVDLQLGVVASTGAEALVVGDTVTYTLNITNANAINVATAPTAGVILPANLQFQASADCSVDGTNILCSLSELSPNSASSVSFTATASSAGESTLIASVSATEPEDIADDNEIVLPVTVITTSPATPATDSAAGGNSGGGAISLVLLLLPFLAGRTGRRRLNQVV